MRACPEIDFFFKIQIPINARVLLTYSPFKGTCVFSVDICILIDICLEAIPNTRLFSFQIFVEFLLGLNSMRGILLVQRTMDSKSVIGMLIRKTT